MQTKREIMNSYACKKYNKNFQKKLQCVLFFMKLRNNTLRYHWEK